MNFSFLIGIYVELLLGFVLAGYLVYLMRRDRLSGDSQPTDQYTDAYNYSPVSNPASNPASTYASPAASIVSSNLDIY